MLKRQLRKKGAGLALTSGRGLALAGVWALSSCAQTPSLPSSERPSQWAQPLTLAGVPNFHQVSPDLYRSAQPSAEGMANLEKLGVRTVINLRSFSDNEGLIGSLALTSQNLPLRTWSLDENGDELFFKILENSPKPVLVHGQHGADRTGALSALYRIKEQGWSQEEAIAEMTTGGFGYRSIWKNLPKWVAAKAVRPSF